MNQIGQLNLLMIFHKNNTMENFRCIYLFVLNYSNHYSFIISTKKFYYSFNRIFIYACHLFPHSTHLAHTLVPSSPDLVCNVKDIVLLLPHLHSKTPSSTSAGEVTKSSCSCCEILNFSKAFSP